MHGMMLLRSMLFVPGNNMRMIHKARALPADAVVLDLEDAVPPMDKETARLFIRDSIADLAGHGVQVFVRLNAAATGLLEADLDWVVQAGLRGLVLPKAEHAQEVRVLNQALASRLAEKQIDPPEVAIVPQIESARGLLHAAEIAAIPGVAALAFGALDYAHDMGISLSPDGVELLYPRSHLAVAARAAGVQAIDTPWFDVEDQEGLQREARLARQLGFGGKLLIHPRQIEPVNTLFSPSESEVEAARKVVEVFRQAKARGIGAVSLDGKMVDIASYELAQGVVARAQAIAERAHGEHGAG